MRLSFSPRIFAYVFYFNSRRSNENYGPNVGTGSSQWRNNQRSQPAPNGDSSDDSDHGSPSRNRKSNVASLAKDSIYMHGRSGTLNVSEPPSPQEHNNVRVISRKESRKTYSQSSSFVPRAVHTSSSNQYSNSSGDEQRKPPQPRSDSNNWAKAPKRFLATEDNEEAPRDVGWQSARPGGIIKATPPRSSHTHSQLDIDSDKRSEASADTIEDPNVVLSSTRAVIDNEAKFIFPDLADDDSSNNMMEPPHANRDSSASDSRGDSRSGMAMKRISGGDADNEDGDYAPPSATTTTAIPTSVSNNNSNRLTGWAETQKKQQQATISNKQISFVHIAHPRGLRSEHVQCTIIRDRTSMQGKLYPTYEMILEDPRKSLIIARKMSLNRTSNYHLFDMTRGYVGAKLSKKAGNYLGKLRAKNTSRTGYALMNHNSDREEIGAILFERPTMVESWTDGNQPRIMKMLLPSLDDQNVPTTTRTHSVGGKESLFDVLQAVEETTMALPDHYRVYQTKEPVFENGNYRLNFHGRVGMPSVKNFQIVSEYDVDDVVCQFGKVDKDVFHLDYKAPLNAIQAFSLALCQFNL